MNFRCRISSVVLMLAVLLSLGSLRAHAQAVYATIHGTVTDKSGAVVPNASVTALNTSTGISSKAVTDSKGYYTFPQLQTGGPYTVTVQGTGFQKFEQTGIMLNVNGNPEVDAALEVGSNTQTVQVQAASIQVETAETQLKTDIGSQEIEQLPLLGRDATQLEKTAPGVMESSDRFGTFSANGAQTQQSDYLLDGADVNDVALQDEGVTPNPDALGEIAVVTNTLNPEYSRNSGAIINETLKTGTNSFHGDGFEFYRDTFLNNGNYFSLPGQRPEFHQNLFGGTFGGPLVKNKLFFFTAYQGFRNRTGTTQQTEVFSPAQDAGNFSADPNLANDNAPNSSGLSGKPMPFAIDGCAAGTAWNACPAFAGGNIVIPPTMWNPLAAKLLSTYVPAANVVEGGAYLYNFNTANAAKQDQGIIRADFHPTANDVLWASSIFQSSPTLDALPFGGADVPGFSQVSASHIKIFNADFTHTFNSNTLNDLRAGYFRFNFAAVEPQTIVPPSSLGFNISPQNPESGLPNMGLTGYFTLGFSFEGPQPRKDTNLLASDTFTKIVGNHNMKFGVQYEQFGVNNPYYADNNGVFSYSGGGAYTSGDPAIDFLLGIPDSYTQASGSIIDAYSHEYYAFGQDSWKAGRDFVVNYGIGWDAETPWSNKQYSGHGITCWHNNSATSTIYPGGPPGLQYAGDPGCTTYGEAYTRWNHFAPRLGFDWSPSSGPSRLVGNPGDHALAIRAGFGMFFNRDSEEEALQNLSSPPYFYESHGAQDFGGSPAFQDPFADVSGAGSEPNPFPYHLPTFGQPLNWPNYAEADFSNVDKQYLPSYAYNFNLNIQRELPGRMVAQIGYVGSLGRKLPRVTEADPITAAGHAACLADPTGTCQSSGALLHYLYPQYTAQPATVAGTTIPWYLSVGDQLSNGASNYNSFQASLQKQTSHGLYFTLAYTYAHALDNGSGYESSSAGSAPNTVGTENGRAVNFVPGFEYLNYGASDYDARQRFVAVYNYLIPLTAGMNSHSLVKEAIGGWHITGDTALQTGFPVTISSEGNFQSLWCDEFTYYSCPDVPNISNTHVHLYTNPRSSPGHLWFDKSVFSPEPTGTFGNTPRNFFRGPGFNYTNLELYKDFPLARESRYIELRLESYNVFNHANFGMPDGNFNDGTFGETLNVIQPASFGGQATDPQPGRATQLAAKFYF